MSPPTAILVLKAPNDPDIPGEAEGEGTAVIECQDGTVWEGYFIVTETE